MTGTPRPRRPHRPDARSGFVDRPTTARRGRHEAARRYRRGPGRRHLGPVIVRQLAVVAVHAISSAIRRTQNLIVASAPKVAVCSSGRAGRTPRRDASLACARNSIGSRSSNSLGGHVVGPGAVGHQPDLVHVDVATCTSDVGDRPSPVTGWTRALRAPRSAPGVDQAVGVGVDELRSSARESSSVVMPRLLAGRLRQIADVRCPACASATRRPDHEPAA